MRRGVFVALKFLATSGPVRRSKDRTCNVLDIRGVLEKEFGSQDERLPAEFASKMYPGVVADLESLIRDVRHGRWPKVARRASIHSGLLVGRGLAPVGRRVSFRGIGERGVPVSDSRSVRQGVEMRPSENPGRELAIRKHSHGVSLEEKQARFGAVGDSVELLIERGGDPAGPR